SAVCSAPGPFGISDVSWNGLRTWPIASKVTRSSVVTRLPSAAGLDPGVEDADLLPVRAVLLDELLVPRVFLVDVVRGLVLEHHVERDVELLVVDGPRELTGQGADAERHGPVVAGEVLLASGHEPLLRLGRGVVQGEEDVVGEDGLRVRAPRRRGRREHGEGEERDSRRHGRSVHGSGLLSGATLPRPAVL